MADELPPPKRDVNELFTLDASDPTSDPDGPLAHLMSTSPLADRDRTSIESAVDDDDAAPEGAATDRDLPGIADIGGLEDLYMTTTELPPGKPSPAPLPPASTGAAEPETGPAPVEPSRSVREVQNLRFSTEAGRRVDMPPDGQRRAPAPAPAPIAPTRSVRVPGQERRRGAVPTALEEITERRWFWGMMAGVIGMAVLALMAAGDLLPTSSVTDPADVVVDDQLPVAPTVGDQPETSSVDASSSTGAGTFGLDPGGPTTAVASSTTVLATTANRRATAAPTTTRTVPSTTTSGDSSTTTASSTTPSTPTTVTTTSTIDPGDTTTTATGGSSTTESPDTTPSTLEETTTTTAGGGGASSSS